MKKEIQTDKAPKPIGPYSQGIMMGKTLFTAGQIAINPETGAVETGDLKKETKMVMSHLNAILQAAGMSFSNVVKCSIFLSDIAHFSTVNEVYGTYFERPFPVRETVAVKTLPKNVNVEISAVAITD
ncbi:MAG: Rid family detoxifying hydrolase [Vicingaceae bacterium]